MKMAVISDIHANAFALNLALQDAKKESVDEFIFLGDYVTDGEYNNETLNRIKKEATHIIAGNREKYILNYSKKISDFANMKPIEYVFHNLKKENINYIKTLKDFEIFEINQFKILIIHGEKYFNSDDDIRKRFDELISHYDFDICFFGHTHQYLFQKYKNRYFLNPGSIGAPEDTPTYKYCIVELQNDVTVSLREFKTEDTLKEFEKDYKATKYYKENEIWANLVLRTIKDGKAHCYKFIQQINNKTKKDENLTKEQYNKIWKETYEEYTRNLK